jgi:hypothetical protein
MSGLDDRISALERRVLQLENYRASTPATADPEPVRESHRDRSAIVSVPTADGLAPIGEDSEPSDIFWALDGLKQRLPAPGGVLFVGAVETARGQVEWQFGLTTDAVMGRDWSDAAASLAALGNPTRLALLNAVMAGIDTVSALAAQVDVGSTGQAYHHVNQLLAHGWLGQSSRGHYVVPAERVVPLMVIIAATAKGV